MVRKGGKRPSLFGAMLPRFWPWVFRVSLGVIDLEHGHSSKVPKRDKQGGKRKAGQKQRYRWLQKGKKRRKGDEKQEDWEKTTYSQRAGGHLCALYTGPGGHAKDRSLRLLHAHADGRPRAAGGDRAFFQQRAEASSVPPSLSCLVSLRCRSTAHALCAWARTRRRRRAGRRRRRRKRRDPMMLAMAGSLKKKRRLGTRRRASCLPERDCVHGHARVVGRRGGQCGSRRGLVRSLVSGC